MRAASLLSTLISSFTNLKLRAEDSTRRGEYMALSTAANGGDGLAGVVAHSTSQSSGSLDKDEDRKSAVHREVVPMTPAEKQAALQAALKIDPGVKPLSWAAIQVWSFGLFLALGCLMLNAIRSLGVDVPRHLGRMLLQW